MSLRDRTPAESPRSPPIIIVIWFPAGQLPAFCKIIGKAPRSDQVYPSYIEGYDKEPGGIAARIVHLPFHRGLLCGFRSGDLPFSSASSTIFRFRYGRSRFSVLGNTLTEKWFLDLSNSNGCGAACLCLIVEVTGVPAMKKYSYPNNFLDCSSASTAGNFFPGQELDTRPATRGNMGEIMFKAHFFDNRGRVTAPDN